MRTSDLELGAADPPELAVDGVRLLHQRGQDGVIDPLETEKENEKTRNLGPLRYVLTNPLHLCVGD